MKTLIEIFSFNVQVLQVGVFIWGVFEIRAVRREAAMMVANLIEKFDDHLTLYHARRKDDAENGKS
jgi:hypothetical protein